MKIKQYKLVTSSELIELEKQVNEYLKKDWQLKGNVFVSNIIISSSTGCEVYTQAMVLYEDKPKPNLDQYIQKYR